MEGKACSKCKNFIPSGRWHLHAEGGDGTVGCFEVEQHYVVSTGALPLGDVPDDLVEHIHSKSEKIAELMQIVRHMKSANGFEVKAFNFEIPPVAPPMPSIPVAPPDVIDKETLTKKERS